MKGYKHLSFTDRLKIEYMLKQKMRPYLIAKKLGYHHSTIYLEIKRGRYMHRNSDWTEEERYSPDIAQQKYEYNLQGRGAALKIGNDIELANYIENKIVNEKYSPAAVLGEIKNKNIKFATSICVGTLYNYIDKGIFLQLTNKDLPVKGRKKRKYRRVRAVKAPVGDSIEKRPVDIMSRMEFGHWEMDTVIGKKEVGKALLVLTERKSRHEILIPIVRKTAECVVDAVNGLERKYKRLFPELFKSITVDNGCEFSDCKGIERSIYGGIRTKLYYCHPYSSWERGSNERQNGILRRFFPKGKSFSSVSDEQIQKAEHWINNYPRRIFGYRSSFDIWQGELKNIVG